MWIYSVYVRSHAGVPAAVWCSSRLLGRWGLVVAGIVCVWVCVLLPKAHADMALERGGCEPLYRQTTLQKWNTGAEICQSIDPAWDLSTTQQLEREMERMKWFENVECHQSVKLYIQPSPIKKGLWGVYWPQTAKKKNGCSFCASGGRRSPWTPFPAPPLFYQCPPLQSLSYPEL